MTLKETQDVGDGDRELSPLSQLGGGVAGAGESLALGREPSTGGEPSTGTGNPGCHRQLQALHTCALSGLHLHSWSASSRNGRKPMEEATGISDFCSPTM